MVQAKCLIEKQWERVCFGAMEPPHLCGGSSPLPAQPLEVRLKGMGGNHYGEFETLKKAKRGFSTFFNFQPPKKQIFRFFNKKISFLDFLLKRQVMTQFWQIFDYFGVFSTPSPLKNRFLGFSTKNFIFGFFAQKVGNVLVLANFWLFQGFSTPSALKS